MPIGNDDFPIVIESSDHSYVRGYPVLTKMRYSPAYDLYFDWEEGGIVEDDEDVIVEVLVIR